MMQKITSCFVEFKIYISLKQKLSPPFASLRFVEFKIYISLKQRLKKSVRLVCFVEFKIYISLKRVFVFQNQHIRFVEFKIYISLKLVYYRAFCISVLQNSKFTYLSNIPLAIATASHVLQNSKFTYLSNLKMIFKSINSEFRYKKMDRHRSEPEGNVDKIFI